MLPLDDVGARQREVAIIDDNSLPVAVAQSLFLWALLQVSWCGLGTIAVHNLRLDVDGCEHAKVVVTPGHVFRQQSGIFQSDPADRALLDLQDNLNNRFCLYR